MNQAAYEGMFIAFEGSDGSGKSYQAKELARKLGAELRRFPDRSTPLGELIDAHLKGKWKVVSDPSYTPQAQTRDEFVAQALQVANRVESVEDLKECLAKGHLVCDRYWPSGVAYAEGLDKEYMVNLNRGLPQPHLFLLMNVDVDTALERMKDRPALTERYDSRIALNRVIQNYRDLWATHAGERDWVVIDASGSKEETAEAIMLVVKSRLWNR